MRDFVIFLAVVAAVAGYGYYKNPQGCRNLAVDVTRDTQAILAAPEATNSTPDAAPGVPAAPSDTSSAATPPAPTPNASPTVVHRAVGALVPASMSDCDTENYLQGADVARRSRKKLLLFFTESDVCLPCQEVERSVLPTRVFHDFVSSSYVMVTVDCPNNTTGLPADLLAQNEGLQKKYRVHDFPTFLFAEPDGTEIKRKVGGTDDPNLLIQILEADGNLGQPPFLHE